MRAGRVSLWLLNVIVTIVGGWCLSWTINLWTINLPYPIDIAIRWGLHIVGHDELANTDDLETIVVLLYLCLCWIAVGLAVWVTNRLRAKRITRNANGGRAIGGKR